MAEEKKPEKEKKPGGGGNKLMLVVIILLVLLLGAVGGLAYYMFTSAHTAPAGDAAHQEDVKKEAKKKHDGPPVFEKMETFVVNLSGGGSLLQIDMQAQLQDEEAKKRFTDYMPRIRSGVLLLLSSKSADELSTPDGKVKLKAQVKQIINESMDAGEEELVQSIEFTSFIIQNQ
ncbi:flagellar basal body-associated FliL family protein [Paludibacterium paludis]|uniref:Flagellar protein FliL n=1 Tax=Paludibacterium paludis TaxID=1225769 RepID=A0A918P0G0_9NEIS|nr:flagellar basal body-associated FliL family protein [Paludibacterium paludis]GGY11046.1 hypothetical protein GCM10011289_12380 [Paludibacterium paludis]